MERTLLLGGGTLLLRSIAFARKAFGGEIILGVADPERESLYRKGVFPGTRDSLLLKETRKRNVSFSSDWRKDILSSDRIVLSERIFLKDPFLEEFPSLVAGREVEIIVRGLSRPGTVRFFKDLLGNGPRVLYVPSFSRLGFEVVEEKDPSLLLIGTSEGKDERAESLAHPYARRGTNVLIYSYEDAEGYRLAYEDSFLKKSEHALFLHEKGKELGFDGDLAISTLPFAPSMNRTGLSLAPFPRGEEGNFASLVLHGEEKTEEILKKRMDIAFHDALEEARRRNLSSLALIHLGGKDMPCLRKSALSLAKRIEEAGLEVRAWDEEESLCRSFKKECPSSRVFLKKEEALEGAIPLALTE